VEACRQLALADDLARVIDSVGGAGAPAKGPRSIMRPFTHRKPCDELGRLTRTTMRPASLTPDATLELPPSVPGPSSTRSPQEGVIHARRVRAPPDDLTALLMAVA